ncbi:MAG TPA: ester cyclase [Candidatus Binatia bacterium]|nr:ester cyclase [Candidatus Binatia bacterium]
MGRTREIVDRFWDRYLAGDYESLAQLVDRDVECRMPLGVVLHGRDEVFPLLRGYLAAIPDLGHEVVCAVEEGDRLAFELRVTGHHTRTLAMPGRELPPTGNEIPVESVDVIQVADDRIVSWHAYYDPIPFLTQLGAMPASPATA